MAGRWITGSSVSCQILVYLIMYLLLNTSPTKDKNSKRINLEMLVASRNISKVRIDSSLKKEIRYTKFTSIKLSRKALLLLRFLNTTQFISLIQLSNVSPNPRPQSGNISVPKGIRIHHLNICSLRNKMDEIRLYCCVHKRHILALNETWLDDSFSNQEVSIDGYNVI